LLLDLPFSCNQPDFVFFSCVSCVSLSSVFRLWWSEPISGSQREVIFRVSQSVISLYPIHLHGLYSLEAIVILTDEGATLSCRDPSHAPWIFFHDCKSEGSHRRKCPSSLGQDAWGPSIVSPVVLRITRGQTMANPWLSGKSLSHAIAEETSVPISRHTVNRVRHLTHFTDTTPRKRPKLSDDDLQK
jgi:hypothetical protein